MVGFEGESEWVQLFATSCCSQPRVTNGSNELPNLFFSHIQDEFTKKLVRVMFLFCVYVCLNNPDRHKPNQFEERVCKSR